MTNPLNPRRGRTHDLPFDLRKLTAREQKLLDAVIAAQQQNNDSLHSDMVGIMKEFNQLARDFQTVAEYLGVQFDSSGEVDYVAGSSQSHDELDGVSADDHHDEQHAVHGPAHTGTFRIPVFPQGEQGEPGFAVPGRRGLTGATGARGADVPGRDGEDGYDAMSIQGRRGETGETGAQGANVPGRDGDDGYDAMSIPGRTGNTGATGAQGPRGAPWPGEEGETGMVVPGPQGPAGNTGATGATGADGDTYYLEAYYRIH